MNTLRIRQLSMILVPFLLVGCIGLIKSEGTGACPQWSGLSGICHTLTVKDSVSDPLHMSGTGQEKARIVFTSNYATGATTDGVLATSFNNITLSNEDGTVVKLADTIIHPGTYYIVATDTAKKWEVTFKAAEILLNNTIWYSYEQVMVEKSGEAK